MRWGLKAAGQSRALFTVRPETFSDKPVFRPDLELWPCIVPASGYYTSCAINGVRQAFYFSAVNGGPLPIAGLAKLWTGPPTGGRTILSCALVVTASNAVIAQVRQHRMPAFLDPKDFGSWLDGSLRREVLAPAPNELVRLWRVSKRIYETATQDGRSFD